MSATFLSKQQEALCGSELEAMHFFATKFNNFGARKLPKSVDIDNNNKNFFAEVK